MIHVNLRYRPKVMFTLARFKCECLELVSGSHIENIAKGKVSAQDIKALTILYH